MPIIPLVERQQLHKVLACDNMARRLEVHLNAVRPCPEFLQTCCGLIRKLADNRGIEERLDFDGAGEVQFFSLGFRGLIPLLQDLGKGSSVDFNKLLELAEICSKLLEAFLQCCKLCGSSRNAMTGLQDFLLVQKCLETDLKFGFLLQVEGVNFVELTF